MKSINYIILIILVTVSVYSCSDDQCNADTDALLKTELLVLDTNLTSIKYLANLSVYSPEWTDSIHYSEEGSKNILNFNLSPISDTTEIVITSLNAALNDTLFIYSRRELLFLSPECGFVTTFTIDTILNSTNYIDSLKIITKNISTEKDGSIKIYF
ncbi:MAG TPA: hypothetical protein DCG75_08420 [Bacteroidales bacterium]|nr:hypothetical protein [Bacteroidales bacterium]